MNQYFDIYLIKGFAKKPNSTKRPDIDLTAETTEKQKRVRGRLRDGCSIFRPEVEIQWDIKPLKTQGGTDYPDPQYRQADINAYNYAYIQLFGDYNTATYGDYFDNVHGRYYYITDIIINSSGLYQLTLEVDPMASYRDDIGNSSQYIVRSALGNYNIPDGTLPTALQRTVISYKGGKLFGDASTQVTVFAGAETENGMASIVAGASLIGMPGFWVDDTGAEPTDAEWESMQVFSLIKGSYTLPLAAADIATQEVTLSAGRFHTKTALIAISPTAKIEKSTSILLPQHPQAGTYPFLASNTYCDYRLFVPFLGVIPVSAGLASGATINITATCDPLSGTANIRCVFGDDASLIQSATVTIAGYSGYGGVIGNSGTAAAQGEAVERGAIVSGSAGFLASAGGVAAASAVATGGAALAAAAIAAVVGVAASTVSTMNTLTTNAINTSIASAKNSVTSVSGGGNRFEGSRTVMITGSFIMIASGATVTGKPDCTIRTVKEAVTDTDTFMTVACPHLEIAGANITEVQIIYQAMAGGFYYE